LGAAVSRDAAQQILRAPGAFVDLGIDEVDQRGNAVAVFAGDQALRGSQTHPRIGVAEQVLGILNIRAVARSTENMPDSRAPGCKGVFEKGADNRVGLVIPQRNLDEGV
jgi:hypothetical protein